MIGFCAKDTDRKDHVVSQTQSKLICHAPVLAAHNVYGV